jgi:hypothetical protein
MKINKFGVPHLKAFRFKTRRRLVDRAGKGQCISHSCVIALYFQPRKIHGNATQSRRHLKYRGLTISALPTRGPL